MRWTVPDLNTRETAILVWIVLALAVALAIPSLRVAVIKAAKTATTPSLAILIVATTSFAATITLCLAWLGYWRTSMIPTTVAWFFGIAILGTFSTDGVGELRGLATRTVALTAVVEFVSNAYRFPLPLELVLIPGIVAFVTFAGFADLRSEFAILRTPFAVFGVALLVGTMTPSVVYVLQHVWQLASAERAREFLLPLVLTLAFLPYLYLVRMAVAWQTALGMLGNQMQDRPALLKAARRTLIRSCQASLSRIQLFEPDFRWRLGSATSEADIRDTMRDFEQAAAERPWRARPGATERSGLWDLLPGAGGGNLLVRSLALADTVQDALASAATQARSTEEEMRELLDHLDGLDGMGAVSLVSRAEVIRVLAQHRSCAEIEAIAPELGKLSTMHDCDIVVLAGDFDSLLRLARVPATESARIAAELHGMSAVTGMPLMDAVEAFVTLLGGTVTDEDRNSQHA